jgi:hypothetical protein
MIRHVLALAAGLGLFATLVVVRVHEAIALLPNPVQLELKLGRADLPRSEPLIVAGVPERGDFLTVRWLDAHTVTLVYDSWGHPGIISAPVAVPPNQRLRLEVALPALDQTTLAPTGAPGRVRVSVDGVTVLDAAAPYHVRELNQLYIGVNPLGGSACGPLLHGRVFLAHGPELRGTPNHGASKKFRLARLQQRAADWFRTQPRQVFVLFAGCSALGWLAGWAATRGWRGRSAIAGQITRHRWFVGASVVASLGYVWLVTLGSLRLDEAEVFGNFYDHQAASLLAGRLDVPEEAILGEAFEARGKLYGYFGPTPALLRLPFVATGLAFGKLSRAFMLAYFVASLLAAYLILREGTRLRRGASPSTGAPASHEAGHPIGLLSRVARFVRSGMTEDPSTAAKDTPSPFATCVLIFSVGWGSTIFFLGSRGLIFHEAILGGIALALWSCWCSVRFLRAPGSRWWIAALIFGVLSIHTRPPTGLFALTLLGVVGVWLALREYLARAANSGRWLDLPRSWWRYAAIGSFCALGAVSLNGLAYLKFGVFDPAPLHLSRPYANKERLAVIDGKSLHAVNLPFNFYTYIIRPNFRVERGFPWIYLGSPIPGHYFPQAKIDLPDHTLAMPYSMPSLFALATLGGLVALVLAPGLRAALALVWLAAVPMTLILFAAVATAQRYTGDFCPPLIAAAALALAGLEGIRAPWRRIDQSLTAAATVAAIAVTVALTLHYQGETLWGVPEETRANYQEMRQTLDRVFGVAPQ